MKSYYLVTTKKGCAVYEAPFKLGDNGCIYFRSLYRDLFLNSKKISYLQAKLITRNTDKTNILSWRDTIV